MIGVSILVGAKVTAKQFLEVPCEELGQARRKWKVDVPAKLLEIHTRYWAVRGLCPAPGDGAGDGDDSDDDDGGDDEGESSKKIAQKNQRISAAMKLRHFLLQLLQEQQQGGNGSVVVCCCLPVLLLRPLPISLQMMSPCSPLSPFTIKRTGS
jgi:hypothetical protein